MRPLTEWQVPATLRGVAFDVDDTVTRDGVLESVSLEALHALRRRLRLVAVTGRPLGWSDVIANQWPVDLAIGENGAGWAWKGDDGFRREYFAGEETRAEYAALLSRIRSVVAQQMPGVHVSDDDLARRCDLAFDVGEARRVSDEDIASLEAIIAAEGARPVTSSVHCHAVPGPWDKARGIERAVDARWGRFDEGEWVFIGDSGNDEAAFARFTHSVGVSNVRESSLRHWPKFVTRRDRGEGFAELAAHIQRALADAPERA